MAPRFPRPAPGAYIVVVEIAGHRDRVKFEIPSLPDAGAAPATPDAVTYSNRRLDKRIGLAIGLAVITPWAGTLIAVALLALVLDLKRRREEVWLLERYPGYAAYRARTRALVPFLY